MNLTVRIADDQDVRVTEELVEFGPPNRVTFAVEEAVRRDGGADDVLLELALFGYGIVVRRNGTVEIGTTGG